jgi:signal transduction histidine kinase
VTLASSGGGGAVGAPLSLPGGLSLGAVSGDGLEVEDRIFAVAPVRVPPGTGVRVVYEIPRDEGVRRVHNRVYRSLVWLLLFLGLMAALAGGVGHFFITRHVERLLRVMERLSTGDLTARTGIAQEPGELGEIARAVDLIAERFHQRDDELRSGRENLEKLVEERTREVGESNRQLEAFNYSISHDLRAPLRAIDGFSQILLNEYATSMMPEGRRILGIVVKNTKRMAQLIDDLLAFSRLGRQAVTALDVNMTDMAREVFEDLTTPKGPQVIDFQLAPLPPARGDSGMIRQIWTNLLSNAIKFTGRTARAVLVVGAEEGPEEHTFFVKDNGVGFDPNHGGKLFHVFQRLHSTSDFEGTGVGLVIVQRIVEKHGGRVWAEGRPNEGACFFFTLPASAAEERT